MNRSNMELKCKNCGKVLKGRWKNYCSRKCGSLFYIASHHHETDIEKKMREWLEKQNINFKSQVSIKNISVPDFVLDNNVLIYCDGDRWHSGAKRRFRDARINSRLQKLNYIVLRYKGSAILKEFDKVAEDILTHLSACNNI